jgi:hypothetical protein
MEELKKYSPYDLQRALDFLEDDQEEESEAL